MATYKYRAFDSSGKESLGILDAESSRNARATLRGRGLLPLEVTDLAPVDSQKRHMRSSRLRESELCLLTRQWSTLLVSGLTVEQSLSALIEQAERPVERQILAGIRAEVVAGHSLHVALDRFEQHFTPIYRASIAAGEQSGQLAIIMNELADYLERRKLLRQKTLQALLYPAIVATVSVLVMLGLMTYVLPSIVAVFQHSRQALPPLTRVIMAISQFLRDWGWLLLVMTALCVVALHKALRKEALRRRWDARLLKLPVVGRYVRTLEAARFASTLAILVGSGVPLLAALEAGRKVVVRLPLREAVAQAIARVREGASLASAIGQSGQFPPLLVHMIANGEITGQLHISLRRAAQMQEADLESRTAFLTTMLEPMLLLVMGLLVMLIVLAVMQPIIDVNQLIL